MSRFWIACAAVAGLCLLFVGCGESSTGDVGPTEGYLCGSDGKTYSLEDADRDEHDVRHRGRCDEPMHCESTNDCFVGDECMPGSDAHWCIPGPTHCNCPGVFEPVCGGDRRNYINACEAACAGVGIRHEGFCDEPPGQGCVRAGCSDHLCVEEGMDIASSCEWRPVYECYQQASCERQDNGQCGFTPTHELVECLERHGEGMCRIDPRWQDGFQAECESPQVPGIVGVIEVKPNETMRLGQWFAASFQLLEPPVLGDVYPGDGLLSCDGEETRFEGVAAMTPFGDLEFFCRILPETHPGECLDDSDCPPGHYCELFEVPPFEEAGPSISPLPAAGMCLDLCALIDCAPGHVCEAGECIPEHPFCGSDDDCPVGWICQEGILGSPVEEGVCDRCSCLDIYMPVCGVDGRTYGNGCEARCAHVLVAHEGECESDCPVETHILNSEGECVPKCYGSEQCGDEQDCNAGQVCAQDPACPACDVCVGWCEPPPDDCRATGCDGGSYCGYCWTSWECIPDGAAC